MLRVYHEAKNMFIRRIHFIENKKTFALQHFFGIKDVVLN